MAQRYPVAALLGARIHDFRMRQGLSVRALAKKAGMPHNNLLLIERGDASPPVETYARLAQALGITLADLCADGSLPARGSDQELIVETIIHDALGNRLAHTKQTLTHASLRARKSPAPHSGTFYGGVSSGLVLA